MSDATAAVVTSWAAEWADEFDQGLSEEYLETLVGHRVAGELEKEDQPPKRFVRNIIGYSKMIVRIGGSPGDDKVVERWGLIDDEGKLLSIYNGMDLRIADGDEEEEG